MDREQARQEIRSNWRTLITGITAPAKAKANGETSYICPFCGHGTHGDGLTRNPKSTDGNGLKCFGCGFSGDIIEMYMQHNNTEYNETLKELAEQLKITIDPGGDPMQKAPRKHTTTFKNSQQERTPEQEAYLAEMKKYKNAFPGSPAEKYLKQRGIGEEVAARFWLGYNAEYKTTNENENGGRIAATWEALIIPISPKTCSYSARNVGNSVLAPEKKNRYRKSGSPTIYNVQALYKAEKPVFVVEGELDALSIIEAGGQAVALGSTSNYNKLVQQAKLQLPAQPLILALDADKEGQKVEEKLAEELTALQVPFYRQNPYGTAKDANEALMRDREAFITAVAAAEHAQEAELEAAAEVAREAYMQTSAAASIADFWDGVKESVNTPAISTGFSNLDEILDGGLYEGLYIIGAISSLGKTTLALQIVDQIAQQGQDCIIFSLEMAKSELMAKSISRHTYLEADNKRDAKTTRGITTGARYAEYGDRTKAIINRATEKYKEYAQHIFIHEGIGDIGVEKVKEVVQQHITFTGNRPVVLIDYLQILAPHDVRASDKQNTDRAVLELKRLSRDYKIPVLGISSFNRDSYKGGNGKVGMTDYKESGAIEYSADVLCGLEFSSAGSKDYDEKAEKKRNPRNIRLVILKNRNGRAWETASFDYYAMFNYYSEV